MNKGMGQRLEMTQLDNFSDYLENFSKEIESKNFDKNQHLKCLLQESKKDLVEMMDESYQDAFNVEIKNKNRG